MTSHSKQEHPFMKHKATFYILVVLVSKYILLLIGLFGSFGYGNGRGTLQTHKRDIQLRIMAGTNL